MKYWLVKSEPETYSFGDLVKAQSTDWDGIRNYQARNFLKEMRIEDRVLFYHSGKEKSVIGIAEVSKEFFPEPQDATGTWVAVELKPLSLLPKPVTLQQIKQSDPLQNIMLIKQSRLSVMPLTDQEYKYILDLGQNQ